MAKVSKNINLKIEDLNKPISGIGSLLKALGAVPQDAQLVNKSVLTLLNISKSYSSSLRSNSSLV